MRYFFFIPKNQKDLSNLAFCSKISILHAHRALYLAMIKDYEDSFRWGAICLSAPQEKTD